SVVSPLQEQAEEEAGAEGDRHRLARVLPDIGLDVSFDFLPVGLAHLVAQRARARLDLLGGGSDLLLHARHAVAERLARGVDLLLDRWSGVLDRRLGHGPFLLGKGHPSAPRPWAPHGAAVRWRRVAIHIRSTLADAGVILRGTLRRYVDARGFDLAASLAY